MLTCGDWATRGQQRSGGGSVFTAGFGVGYKGEVRVERSAFFFGLTHQKGRVGDSGFLCLLLTLSGKQALG